MKSAQPRASKKPRARVKVALGSSGTSLPSASQLAGRLNRKPLPIEVPTTRKHCPVCGEVSYSAAGIHPQCAMQQADAKRTKQIKRAKNAQKLRMTATDASDLKPWHRVCPRCKAVVHIRRRVCSCGNRFRAAKVHNSK